MEAKMLTDEQIEKAVEWWAQAIQSPAQSAGLEGDGDLIGSLVTGMLQSKVAAQDIVAFKAALTEELRSATYIRDLSVDYHPERELAAAARAANLPDFIFPWKTSTLFTDDGRVLARRGYDAQEVEI